MTKEHRRYFRTDDIVSLHTRSISKNELNDRVDDFLNGQNQSSIRNEYNRQLEENYADFHSIEKKMPELGRYLTLLQNQITLLTEKRLPEESPNTGAEQAVNLSAQGISYNTDQSADEGDLVELNMKLLPQGQKIVALARVIKVRGEPGNGQGHYKISLDFEHINDTDREILIKHVYGKQMRALSSSHIESIQGD